MSGQDIMVSALCLNKVVGTIRDELIQKDLLSKKITKTLSRVAVEQSAATIKSNWTTTKKKVKKAIAQNENLTKDDKHYLYLCLKHTPTLYNILNYKKLIMLLIV